MFHFDPTVAYQKVMCISPRSSLEGQIVKGEHYILDRLSIWIDSDGDAYGTFYSMNQQRIGQLKLSHFCSI